MPKSDAGNRRPGYFIELQVGEIVPRGRPIVISAIAAMSPEAWARRLRGGQRVNVKPLSDGKTAAELGEMGLCLHRLENKPKMRSGSKRRLEIILFVVTTGLAGCASVPVQRATGVSAAGVAYARATEGVIDVAIDASIDASSQSKLLGKPRTPVTDAAVQTAREAELKQVDDELVKSSISYMRLKRSVNATEAYFKALQQLADGSPSEAAESAVTALAARLNGLNNAMDTKSDGAPLIGDEKKEKITGLSKLVVTQVHGAIVARTLERDAPVIGRTLLLQEIVLKAAEDDIRANLTNAAARFYTSKVVGPYRTGAIDDTWADDRRAYLKVKALGNTPEALTSAQAAARQMQTAWARILSGEYSAKELTAMLKDTEDLLAAVAALKEANAKK